ncbi:hypothetical protein FLGE108171_15910 [Flavobacterium gelidilacus]|uniref:hypothetical protein n=1 Tax=Flavobacterium gelidilacus TaxID=206041 RepID=UPI0039EE4809
MYRKRNTINRNKIIINQLIFLLLVFGILAIAISLLSGLYKNLNNLIFPFFFVLGLSFFGILMLIIFENIKTLREKNFFSKIPFNEIEKRTIRKTKVSYSKYEFPKTQRIIELNGKELAIEYYDNFFKIPISDVLIIYDIKNLNSEPRIINYKKTKFNKLSLIKELQG